MRSSISLPSSVESSYPRMLISERCSPCDRRQQPSVIQFRGEGSRKPDALARTLLANLPQLVDALENGSIVTFEPARVRVRLLPIGLREPDE
jgi:hypothetical protein